MNTIIKQMTKLNLIQQPLLQNCKTIISPIIISASFHTSNPLATRWNKHNSGPQKWLQNNKILHPPQQPEEEPRKAYVCHMRTNIKYSPEKMWYVACLVRGLSVDEAIKQLNFVLMKGAVHVKEVINEARELAIEQHHVEYKSNLWVSESFVGKGRVFRGLRRHARGRTGRVEYKHCHYFVRLEEGTPPKDYYIAAQTPQEQFDKWLQQMRNRKITSSL